jgi:heme A synthase
MPEITGFVHTSYIITLTILTCFLTASLWRRFAARSAIKRSMMDSES